ncbi:MAG: hypothetical protein JEZ06_00265 [Anaerolineaceae bacterium]|nr:hypothetical protein [Anaerolineaceae bacterium]
MVHFRKEFFPDPDQVSGTILGKWLYLCGVSRRTILNEINLSNSFSEKIGSKSFQQWTSSNDSAKRISARSQEETGNRLVAIVKWFASEHFHRKNSIIETNQLESLIKIYDDIPIKNRMQLMRILHDLQLSNGEIENKLPIDNDWKNQLLRQPLCAFVMDKYWCIRASTHYELAFAGYSEKDNYNWGCWHRLAASMDGIPKHSHGSPMSKTRGPYSQEYYEKQIVGFREMTEGLSTEDNKRYQTVLELLNQTAEFQSIWDSSKENEENHSSNSIGFPVPFYRNDGALVWMMELSTIISNTDGYRLITWLPTDHDSSMYLADFLKSVDNSNKFSKKCYFIEDYSTHFSDKQKLALGV